MVCRPARQRQKSRPRHRPRHRPRLHNLPIDGATPAGMTHKKIRRGRLILRRPRKLAVFRRPAPPKSPQRDPQAGPSNPNANCVQARANQRQPVELSVLLQPCHCPEWLRCDRFICGVGDRDSSPNLISWLLSLHRHRQSLGRRPAAPPAADCGQYPP